MYSLSLNEQKDCLQSLLLKLEGLIKKTPTILPCSSSKDPIAKHFSHLLYDATEGPYYTCNKSWECSVRGKYDFDLVQACIVHFSNISGIKTIGGLQLMAQQVVETLISLIVTMYESYYHPSYQPS